MARVYSWEVSNSPKKYAYIVHPSNSEIAFIGNELTGSELENVSKWASNCTDDEYEAHFKMVKELCASQNYLVSFEDVSSYINVKSSCDNLRGPAGRGISYIALSNTSDESDTYAIVYDDGTTDSFLVKHGKPGRDGVDGTPGAKGDDPVSTCFKMIYTSGSYSNGEPITHKDENGKEIIGPSKPKGGEYNFLTNRFTVPNGWSVNDSGLIPPVWMSSRTFTTSPTSTDNEWSSPIQITGDNGKPGEDGLYSEFIYQINPNEPSTPTDSKNEAGYVPSSWTSSPTGVDEDNTIEWSCIRRLKKVVNEITKKETKEWGPWETPTIWSKYGVNGQDGDGIQYMYIKNKGQFPKNPTPANWKTDEEFQDKDNEWLPKIDVKYLNIKGDEVIYSPLSDKILPDGETDENGNTIYPPGIWTDNPTDVDDEFQYQWVCSRKYKILKDENDGSTSKKKMWTEFSNPSLWGKFGEQGKSGTVIRKLYFLTQNTNQVPKLPTSSVITGEWSGGFPIDYVNGENVVWGTEAELWAHNNEFVKNYILVSSINADGNVEKPDSIVTEEDKQNNPNLGVINCKTLSYIPTEQYKDSISGIVYKYICVNDSYYEWRNGGWCDPYLVSGLKGDPAPTIDFLTTAFVYGYEDFTPIRPNFSDPKNLGTTGSENAPSLPDLKWEDFPNTKGDQSIGVSVRIDGSVDKSGYKRRWYQCQGEVNGSTLKVKSVEDEDGNIRYLWGGVFPNSPKDGESIMGRYTEYRFAVTETADKPSVSDYVNGEVNRNPIYYNNRNIACGWFTTSESLPDIPEGGAQWMINAIVDGQTDELISQNGKYWSSPLKISGEKGEKGEQGPTGLRGTTGIPGASQKALYCLGIDSNSGEYYFIGNDEDSANLYNEKLILSGMSSGYFGCEITKSNKSVEINGWFDSDNMPYSTPTEVSIDATGLTNTNIVNASKKDDKGNYLYNPTCENEILQKLFSNHITEFENVKEGEIIKIIINSTEKNVNGAEMHFIYNQYLLKYKDENNGNFSVKRLTRILTTGDEGESKDFSPIIWSVQGSEIIERGASGIYETDNTVSFYGNTTTINVNDFSAPTDSEMLSSTPPSIYNGKTYLCVSESSNNLYYKWGRSGDSYNHIKVLPIVVDESNSKRIKNLDYEESNTNNGLPKHQITVGTVAYKYIIDDRDGIVGINDCYKWNEFDGDAVTHQTVGVNWKTPYRLQGVNGLRGMSGSRGQTIYPMGNYANDEVYIATKEKAPYIYDSDDGLYYIYEIVDEPWVGILPNNYPFITVKPADYEENYTGKEYSEYKINNSKTDPLSSDFTGVTLSVNQKYIYISNYVDKNSVSPTSTPYTATTIEAYFEKIGESNGGVHKNFKIAHKFKYQFNGKWITDQNGMTPGKHYANRIEDNQTPVWTRFESFKAMYTSVGIIANGLIGSAVFNNEFMFSQQGKDYRGVYSEFKTVSESGYSYGFLSGYEYDETGIVVNGKSYHWHYRGTNYYLDESDVNPYEIIYNNSSDGIIDVSDIEWDTSDKSEPIIHKKTKIECFIGVKPNNTKGQYKHYLHTFMPNVCTNFASGEMWLASGDIQFETNKTLLSGYLGIKNGNGDVVGFINGNNDIVDNEGKTISMALGIKDNGETEPYWKYTAFKMSDDGKYKKYVQEIENVQDNNPTDLFYINHEITNDLVYNFDENLTLIKLHNVSDNGVLLSKDNEKYSSFSDVQRNERISTVNVKNVIKEDNIFYCVLDDKRNPFSHSPQMLLEKKAFTSGLKNNRIELGQTNFNTIGAFDDNVFVDATPQTTYNTRGVETIKSESNGPLDFVVNPDANGGLITDLPHITINTGTTSTTKTDTEYEPNVVFINNNQYVVCGEINGNMLSVPSGNSKENIITCEYCINNLSSKEDGNIIISGQGKYYGSIINEYNETISIDNIEINKIIFIKKIDGNSKRDFYKIVSNTGNTITISHVGKIDIDLNDYYNAIYFNENSINEIITKLGFTDENGDGDGVGGDIEDNETSGTVVSAYTIMQTVAEDKTIKSAVCPLNCVGAFNTSKLILDNDEEIIVFRRKAPTTWEGYEGEEKYDSSIGTLKRNITSKLSAPMTINEDGTITAKQIILNLNEFNGEINATGTFNGNVVGGIVSNESIITESLTAKESNLNIINGNELNIDEKFIVSPTSDIDTGTLPSYSEYIIPYTKTTKVNAKDKVVTVSGSSTIFEVKLTCAPSDIESIVFPKMMATISVYNGNRKKYTCTGDTVFRYYINDNELTGMTSTQQINSSIPKNSSQTFANNPTGGTINAITSITSGSSVVLKIKFDYSINLNEKGGVWNSRKSELNIAISTEKRLKVDYNDSKNTLMIGKNAFFYKNGNTKVVFSENGIELKYGDKGITINSSGVTTKN